MWLRNQNQDSRISGHCLLWYGNFLCIFFLQSRSKCWIFFQKVFLKYTPTITCRISLQFDILNSISCYFIIHYQFLLAVGKTVNLLFSCFRKLVHYNYCLLCASVELHQLMMLSVISLHRPDLAASASAL